MYKMLLLAYVFNGSAFIVNKGLRNKQNTSLNGYVPDGLTKAEWDRIKTSEKRKGNLGKIGPGGYKSRSFESFQRALESGDPNAKNMAVFFAKERLKNGEIRLKDIPYMQRGGSWDNSDIRGMKRNKWTTKDVEYERMKDKAYQMDMSKMTERELWTKLGAVRSVSSAPKIKDDVAKRVLSLFNFTK